MLAYRATYLVKWRCMQKALELVKAEISRGKPENSDVRVYTPGISPNLLVVEETWESVEEHDKFWAEYRSTPEFAAFWEEWNELIERWVGTEIWNLTEWK